MSEVDGLLCAYVVDGRGGARELDWSSLEAYAGDDFIWVHLHLEGGSTKEWLTDKSGLPSIVAEALLYEDVRPRCTPVGSGLIVSLRGVNLNPGAEPEDMVAVRVYIDAKRVVTVRGVQHQHIYVAATG